MKRLIGIFDTKKITSEQISQKVQQYFKIRKRVSKSASTKKIKK